MNFPSRSDTAQKIVEKMETEDFTHQDLKKLRE